MTDNDKNVNNGSGEIFLEPNAVSNLADAERSSLKEAFKISI